MLIQQLKILRPLINKQWIGGFVDPVSRKTIENRQSFETAREGKVVKYLYAIPAINSFAEGYFYRNRDTKQIEAFILHHSAVIQKGVVTLEEGLITIKGTMIFPDRKFEFRNTFESKNSDTKIDRWYQNAFGPWNAGYSVRFSSSTRSFKSWPFIRIPGLFLTPMVNFGYLRIAIRRRIGFIDQSHRFDSLPSESRFRANVRLVQSDSYPLRRGNRCTIDNQRFLQ